MADALGCLTNALLLPPFVDDDVDDADDALLGGPIPGGALGVVLFFFAAVNGLVHALAGWDVALWI